MQSSSKIVRFLSGSAPLAACLAVLTACGGPGLILKGPISSKCESTGLSGCEDLTKGALAFVGGKQAEGKRFLQLGIAANMKVPGKLKEFAAQLRPVVDLPGVGSYAGPLKTIIQMIDDAAATAGPTGTDAVAAAASAEGAEPAEAKDGAAGEPTATASATHAASEPTPKQPEAQQPQQPRSSRRNLRAATVLLSSEDPLSAACSPLSSYGQTFADSSSLCRPIATGTATVVGAYVTAQCPNRIVLSVGDPAAPRWYVMSSPDQPFSLAGLELPVAEGQQLNVSMIANDRKRLRPDLRCAVTIVVSAAAESRPSGQTKPSGEGQ